MAIARVCEGCGCDVSRARASREPVYGLWVARCPGCGKVEPRGRVTDGSLGRRAGRVYFALLRLEVRTVGVGAGVVACSMGADALADWGVRGWEISSAGWTLLGATLLVGGAFVHLAWSHHALWRRWVGLWLIVSAISSAPVLAWALSSAAHRWSASWFDVVELDRALLLMRLAWSAALPAAALLIGWPVAAGLGVLHESVRATRWRGRLARARKRRFA